jgi:hypothetical protein
MLDLQINVYKASKNLSVFVLENFDSIKLLDTGFEMSEELLLEFNKLVAELEKKEKEIASYIPKY